MADKHESEGQKTPQKHIASLMFARWDAVFAWDAAFSFGTQDS